MGRDPGRLPGWEVRLAGRETLPLLPAGLGLAAEAEVGREEGRLGGRGSLEPALRAAAMAAGSGWVDAVLLPSGSSVAPAAGVGAGASGAEATAASSSSPSSCAAAVVCSCGLAGGACV